MDIKLSVIVPAYNCQEYLSKCVESILKQTYKNFELIIINDGSTDKTGKIIDYFAKKDSRVIPIHQKNMGPGKSRNVGIDRARGAYITFVDSDDYIEADMYEKMIKTCQKNDSYIDIIMCGYIEEYQDERKNQSINYQGLYNEVLKREDILKKILLNFVSDKKTGVACLWNKLYRAKFLEQNALRIDETRDYGEDWVFNIQAFERANTCCVINSYLYHYVQINSDSLMRKKRKNQVELVISGRQILNETISKYDLEVDKIEYNKKFFGNFFAALLSAECFSAYKLKKYVDIDIVQEALKYEKSYPIVYRIFSKLLRYKKYRGASFYLKSYQKIKLKE